MLAAGRAQWPREPLCQGLVQIWHDNPILGSVVGHQAFCISDISDILPFLSSSGEKFVFSRTGFIDKHCWPQDERSGPANPYVKVLCRSGTIIQFSAPLLVVGFRLYLTFRGFYLF